MEQVFVVLAVIVYMLFQGAARAGRRSGAGGEPPPRAPEDEQADAQERALETLRRWEARQRAAADPKPGERGRREAHAAIAGMLGRRVPVPPVPEDETVRSLETLVSAEETPRRLRAPAKGRVVPGERRRAPAPRPERVPAVRRRARREGEEAPGGAASRRSGVPPAGSGRERRGRGGGGLDRLDALPPLARAVVLSEVLGPPPSLRGRRLRP